MDVLSGTIDAIHFSKPESGWTVARLEAADTPFGGSVAIVGVMPGLVAGMQINVQGEWADHPRFGRQFQVKSYQTQTPQSGPALEIFLQEVVYGIGPALARRIVAQFGEATAQVMDNPDALRQVPGIGRERANEIAKSWREHQHERAALEDILAFLVAHDIATGYARKIFDEFGFAAVDKLRSDPYQLTRIDGIGFKKADAIAMRLGFQSDSPERIRAALLYTLEQATHEGHCYLERADLLDRATQQLLADAAPHAVEQQLTVLLADKDLLVQEGAAIYQTNLRRAESETAEHLLRLAGSADEKMLSFQAFSRTTVFQDMPKVAFAYTEQQLAAIWTALTQKVSVITGGPGTGKTTLVNAIVALALAHDHSVMQVAPTGKAAKRLSEVPGYPASTIHRALGINPATGAFLADEEHPLDVGLVIVDETSMLDISLARCLLRAIPDGAHVVFVGDVDQLPSVGPGNVLRDIIVSETFPVTRLQNIFRQGDASLIIPNAHAINHGEMPQFARNGAGSDFYLFEAADAETAGDWIVDLATERIPGAFGVAPGDIQVLSPLHAGAAGDEALNVRLQAALNPSEPDKAELQHGKRTFRVGDRVIQIKNDYDRDVYNGDMGRVVRIGKNDKGDTTVWIEFDDGQAHEYAPSDLGEVKHAYALTVHKSQGSEFPVVVIPVLTQHYVMLQRNLLYTGVTRAKRLVVLVGNRKALGIAISNAKVQQRNARLCEKIRALKQSGNF